MNLDRIEESNLFFILGTKLYDFFHYNRLVNGKYELILDLIQPGYQRRADQLEIELLYAQN